MDRRLHLCLDGGGLPLRGGFDRPVLPPRGCKTHALYEFLRCSPKNKSMRIVNGPGLETKFEFRRKGAEDFIGVRHVADQAKS